MSGRTGPLLLRCEHSINWIFNSDLVLITGDYIRVYNVFSIILQQYNLAIIKIKVLPKEFLVYVKTYKKKFTLLRDYARKAYRKSGFISYKYFNVSGIRYLALRNILRLNFLKYKQYIIKNKGKSFLYLLCIKKAFLCNILFPFMSRFNKLIDYTHPLLNLKFSNALFKKMKTRRGFSVKNVKRKYKFIVQLSTIKYRHDYRKSVGIINISKPFAWIRLLYTTFKKKRLHLKINKRLYNTTQLFRIDNSKILAKKKFTKRRIRPLVYRLYGFFKVNFISILLSSIVSKTLIFRYAVHIQNILNCLTYNQIPVAHKRYWGFPDTRHKFFIIYISFILYNSWLINTFIRSIIKNTKFKKHVLNLRMFTKYVKLLHRKSIFLIKGFKLQITGKLGGKLRCSKYKFRVGVTSNFVFNTKMAYNFMPIYTKYGVFASKVWLYKNKT